MRKNFTKIVMLAAAGLFSIGGVLAQGTQGKGVGWGSTGEVGNEPLIVNENFQNWEKTHSVATQEIITAGGSAGVSSTWVDKTVYVPAVTDENVKIAIDLISCAVAPDFHSQYYYNDDMQDFPKDLVSKGFVELGRTNYPPVAPSMGEFIIRNLEYVEGLQYSYTSSGGNKRGFELFMSVDDGATWTSIRHETGNFNTSTSGIDVQASGYGLRFEDAVYESNVSFKFTVSSINPQIVRLHDLKIYGSAGTGNSIELESGASFKIKNTKQEISLTANADVEIYSTTGTLVKAAQNATNLNITDLPSGVYVVKAVSVEGISLNKKIVK